MKQTRLKLKNGINLLHYDLPATSSTTISAMFRVGAIAENYEQFGMAHYVEHMLFDGSKKYPNPTKTHQYIETAGIVENAWTSKNLTNYYMKLPLENFQKGADILFDRINSPLFTDEAFKKENGIIIEEIKMGLDKPDHVAWENLCAQLFYDTPLAHPVIGHIDTVEKFSPEMLRDFYNKYYHNENLIIWVGGNIGTDKVVETLEQYPVPQKTDNQDEHKPYPIYDKTRVAFTKMDVRMNTVMLAINGFSFFYEHLDSAYVSSAIFGLGQGSILNNELKINRPLVAYADAELYPLNTDGLFVISFVCPVENTKETAKRILDSFFNMAEGSINIKAIKRAKNMLLGTFQRLQETSASMSGTSGYFNLPSREIITGEKIDFDGLVKTITEVEKDHITNSLQKAIKGKRFFASIAGPNAKSQVELKELLDNI